MSLDIRAGDLLINGTDTYPIKGVSNWNMPARSSYFFRLATAAVSTKRAQATGGKIASALSAADYLTGLKATPIEPLSGEAILYAEKNFGLDKPTQLLQTFISDGTSFVHLILERKL